MTRFFSSNSQALGGELVKSPSNEARRLNFQEQIKERFNSLWNKALTFKELNHCKTLADIIEELQRKDSPVFEKKRWPTLEEMKICDYILIACGIALNGEEETSTKALVVYSLAESRFKFLPEDPLNLKPNSDTNSYDHITSVNIREVMSKSGKATLLSVFVELKQDDRITIVGSKIQQGTINLDEFIFSEELLLFQLNAYSKFTLAYCLSRQNEEEPTELQKILTDLEYAKKLIQEHDPVIDRFSQEEQELLVSSILTKLDLENAQKLLRQHLKLQLIAVKKDINYALCLIKDTESTNSLVLHARDELMNALARYKTHEDINQFVLNEEKKIKLSRAIADIAYASKLIQEHDPVIDRFSPEERMMFISSIVATINTEQTEKLFAHNLGLKLAANKFGYTAKMEKAAKDADYVLRLIEDRKFINSLTAEQRDRFVEVSALHSSKDIADCVLHQNLGLKFSARRIGKEKFFKDLLLADKDQHQANTVEAPKIS